MARMADLMGGRSLDFNNDLHGINHLFYLFVLPVSQMDHTASLCSSLLSLLQLSKQMPSCTRGYRHTHIHMCVHTGVRTYRVITQSNIELFS